MSKHQNASVNRVNVENIIQSARVLLKQENIEFLPSTTFDKYIKEYPIPQKLVDLQEQIRDKLKLMYWAVAGVSIELGYMLIFIESFNQCKRVDDWYNVELSYMFIVHHYFMTYESIYRVWERFSRVLYFIHAKKSKNICYYHNVVEVLKKSNEYPDDLMKEILSHKKEWGHVKDARNKFSHEYSKLTYGINFEVIVSPLVNEKGNNLLLVQENRIHELMIKDVKEQYNYFKQLDKTLEKFIKVKSSE